MKHPVKTYQLALRRILKAETSSKHQIFKYLGTDTPGFIHYIKSNLRHLKLEDLGKTWEIGHIVPVNYFDQTNENDLKLCWNYENLIPLEKHINKQVGACPFFSYYILDKKVKTGTVNQLKDRVLDVIRSYNM
jgi:hypothetical protein